MENQEIAVGFLGNPNCGKTTLFNAFTGAKLKVANWPGVTVEKKEGETSYEGRRIRVIDLPGIYSLSSYTMEEKVSRECVLSPEVDVIVNVVDASHLERSLYLTLQLLEIGKPVIVALNMMDIVQERGMEIDLHRLPELLGGAAVVPVSARKKSGLNMLLHAVVHHYDEGPAEEIFHYSPYLEDKIGRCRVILEAQPNRSRMKRHLSARWQAIKLLEYDEEMISEAPQGIHHVVDQSYENEIIQEKYNYIEAIIRECLFHREKRAEQTDRVDGLLTHPVWGLPIFFGIMALVFAATFLIGDQIAGLFEEGVGAFGEGVRLTLAGLGASEMMLSLVVDGIIAGVGGILTFLPNIAILFFALALLEDSGYMARVAYIMDGIMGKAGLSGRAFLPMILGFGCSVPAVMATRALERQEDRRKLMYVIPFMSCSARVPVYVLLSSAFFGKYAVFAAFSMYVIGFIIGILVSIVMGKFTAKDEPGLLIELPEYKLPNAHTVYIYVWNKVKDYLSKAGTTIFIASVALWIVLNFNASGITEDITTSFGASIGKWLAPLMAPAGLGFWQVCVALLAGISAKEVVVSSFSVIFGISNINSAQGLAEFTGILSSQGFTAWNAYALMLFVLLYTPCVATIATIRAETGSWKFTGKVLLFQLLFAWAVTAVFYQTAGLLMG